MTQPAHDGRGRTAHLRQREPRPETRTSAAELEKDLTSEQLRERTLLPSAARLGVRRSDARSRRPPLVSQVKRSIRAIGVVFDSDVGLLMGCKHVGERYSVS